MFEESSGILCPMTAEKSMGLPERDAAVVVAAGLSRRLLDLSISDESHAGAENRFTGFQSTSKTACRLLERLDLAELCQDDGCSYTLCPPAEVLKLRSASGQNLALVLAELLEAYLDLACSLGPAKDLLPTTRSAFKGPRSSRLELTALTRLGYLEMVGESVRWTDKVQAMMQKLGFWDEKGRDFDSLYNEWLQESAVLLLDATPQLLRQRLRKMARKMDHVEFAVLLRDQFDGLYCKSNPDGTLRSKSEQDTRLPFLIHKLLSLE